MAATLPPTSFWTINDTRVALTVGGATTSVDIRDARTGGPRATIPNAFHGIVLPHGEVAFWPDGSGIRDPRLDSIWVRLADGRIRKLLQLPGGDDTLLSTSFDGTGRRVRGRERERRRPVPLRHLAARSQDGAHQPPDHRPRSRWPALRSDGRVVAYTREHGVCADGVRASDIVLLTVATGKRRALTRGSCTRTYPQPRSSPTARWSAIAAGASAASGVRPRAGLAATGRPHRDPALERRHVLGLAAPSSCWRSTAPAAASRSSTATSRRCGAADRVGPALAGDFRNASRRRAPASSSGARRTHQKRPTSATSRPTEPPAMSTIAVELSSRCPLVASIVDRRLRGVGRRRDRQVEFLPAAVASATTASAPAVARSFGSFEAGFGEGASAAVTAGSSMPNRP